MDILLLLILLASVYSIFGVVCLFLLRIPVHINWIVLFTVSGLVSGAITILLFLLIAGDGNWKLPSANLVDVMFITSIMSSVLGSIVSVKVGKNITSACN